MVGPYSSDKLIGVLDVLVRLGHLLDDGHRERCNFLRHVLIQYPVKSSQVGRLTRDREELLRGNVRVVREILQRLKTVLNLFPYFCF